MNDLFKYPHGRAPLPRGRERGGDVREPKALFGHATGRAVPIFHGLPCRFNFETFSL